MYCQRNLLFHLNRVVSLWKVEPLVTLTPLEKQINVGTEDASSKYFVGTS